nr:putative ribonuclease h protein [Quercus suber]
METTKDGVFSAKSAYLANISHDLAPPFQGAWIWKLDVLPKIVNIFWLWMHKSVPMKNILATRGIMEDKFCPLCKSLPETIGHLLRDCKYARDFWHKIKVPPDAIQSFQVLDVDTWLRENCLSKAMHQSLVPWQYVFPFAI